VAGKPKFSFFLPLIFNNLQHKTDYYRISGRARNARINSLFLPNAAGPKLAAALTTNHATP
jgi:hypothetical protein